MTILQKAAALCVYQLPLQAPQECLKPLQLVANIENINIFHTTNRSNDYNAIQKPLSCINVYHFDAKMFMVLNWQ